MTDRVPVGVLLSGRGTNLQALLDACAQPGFPARVAVVLSNRRDAGGLQRARDAGVPATWIPHRGKARADHEAELVAALEAHGCRWVCCAGYLRVLTPAFLDAFPGRVLNIHPSLLPAFPGLRGPDQARAHGARIAGATVHLVTPGMDEGPIVCQGACPVLPQDTDEALAARILRLEHQLYPRALRWAVEGRLSLDGRAVSVDLPPGEQTWAWLDA